MARSLKAAIAPSRKARSLKVAIAPSGKARSLTGSP